MNTVFARAGTVWYPKKRLWPLFRNFTLPPLAGSTSPSNNPEPAEFRATTNNFGLGATYPPARKSPPPTRVATGCFNGFEVDGYSSVYLMVVGQTEGSNEQVLTRVTRWYPIYSISGTGATVIDSWVPQPAVYRWTLGNVDNASGFTSEIWTSSTIRLCHNVVLEGTTGFPSQDVVLFGGTSTTLVASLNILTRGASHFTVECGTSGLTSAIGIVQILYGLEQT